MSLDVSGLSAYTDENKMALIKEAILKGRTVDIVRVQPEIKSTATINRLGGTLDAQAGACGWTEAGTVSLTQRSLAVVDVKVNESVCLSTLESYYLQTQMNPGSYNTELPFEQLFTSFKVEQVQELIENLIWRGNTSTGVGDLALMDGMIATLAGATGSLGYYDSSANGLTAGNVIDVVDDLVDNVPNKVINAPDLKLFMSYPTYRTLMRAYRDSNLFHYDGQENQTGEFRSIIPGTNVEAVATSGLDGDQEQLVLMPASNFYVGTDMVSDYESFKLWYSQDNDEVRFRVKFKLGVNVAYLDEVAFREYTG